MIIDEWIDDLIERLDEKLRTRNGRPFFDKTPDGQYNTAIEDAKEEVETARPFIDHV